jgi:hypothetical protein
MTNVNTSDFVATMAKAEAALKQRRRSVPLSKDGTQAAPEPTPDSQKRGTITVDGVSLPSLGKVEDMLEKMRSDLNSILDTFEPTQPSNTVPLRVEVMSGDDMIGAVDGASHYMLPTLLKACAVRPALNIMIKGEMGGGKSTAARQVAEALGLSFGYIGQTLMPHDVMGYMHPVTSEYHWTPFTKAYVEGGVIVLEEMDGWSPNATLSINAPLANGYVMLPNGEMHDRHPDCIIISCTNTWGTGPTAEYVGRNKLDNAFLDRFGVKLDWKYDTALERMVAGNDEVVDVIQTARMNARRAGIKVPISPRASIDVAKLVAAGFGMREALDMNILSSLDADQRRVILDGCEVTS